MAEPGYPRGETVFDRFGRAIGLGRPPERVVIQARSPYGDTGGREVEVPNPLPPGWDARPRPAAAPSDVDPDPGGHQGAWDAAVNVPTRVGGARRLVDSPYPESGTRGPSEQPWQGIDSPDQYYSAGTRTRDPGETGGQPVVERPGERPAPPKPSNGGRGAINTGGGPRLPLGDQRRIEAFDPTLDANDPGNRHLVTADGRPNVFETTSGAVAPGGRERTAPSGEVDVRGPAQQGMSSNNVANDMTPAIQAGTSWLHRMFHQTKRDEHTDRSYPAMVKGVGAPSFGEVHAVFAAVDPKNELPMNRKMELATRAGHDWLMSRAQNAATPQEKADLEQRAGRFAGEMMQFSVKMAAGHGEQAVEAMKNGNIEEAVHQIQAGYGWMADGHHIDRQGNMLLMKDQNGRVTQTMPITPEYVKNIALGMSTGELSHDVYRSRAQAAAPPAAAPGRQPWDERVDTSGAGLPTIGTPAAQPSVAAAGPTAPRPATPAPAPATPTATPPAATPVAGTPPAGGPAQAIAPVAPSSLAPVTQGGAPAPATPPTVTPPGQTAPAAAPVTPAGKPQGTDTRPPEAEGQEPMYRHVSKPPDNSVQLTLPPLGNQPARQVRVTLDDAEKNIENVFDQKRAEIMKETDALPKADKWVRDKRIEALNKQQAAMTAHIKEQRAEYNRRLDKENTKEEHHLKPHVPSNREMKDYEADWVAREKEIRDEAKTNPQSHSATVLPVSPIRYLEGPAQMRPITDIARAIKVHNNTAVNSEQAMDIALDITRHVPDTTGGKPADPKTVFNGKVGKDGAYYVRMHDDYNGNVVLKTSSGATISIPHDVFRSVVDQRKQSYARAEKDEKENAKKGSATKRVIDRTVRSMIGQGL